MKKQTKIILVALSVIMIVIAGIILFSREVPSTTSSGGVISFPDVTKDNLRFSDARLVNNNLTVLVQNTTGSNYNLKTINVRFQDASNNEIITITGYIGESLTSNEFRKLDVKTDVDLSNAKSVEYIINK